ncbi:hypothetical protein [Wolbachia endosymbiont of Onchocerca volvulus]|uniref:hypothetical protein n=1 Tax=Onchocerca volvulus endobacterium TaxID=77551 RepID=UPI00046CF731|nr:hypothetical protein [Wolbachia endosymbiont of Onchocerca volvulus]
MQKNRLAKKGENADILFVTATPRTLQQAMYNSIEYLVLRKKKSESRLSIKTVTINIKKVLNFTKRFKNTIYEQKSILNLFIHSRKRGSSISLQQRCASRKHKKHFLIKSR